MRLLHLGGIPSVNLNLLEIWLLRLARAGACLLRCGHHTAGRYAPCSVKGTHLFQGSAYSLSTQQPPRQHGSQLHRLKGSSTPRDLLKNVFLARPDFQAPLLVRLQILCQWYHFIRASFVDVVKASKNVLYMGDTVSTFGTARWACSGLL
jgi:hypothetical protein